MSKQLNPEEIEKLFLFCRKHYVNQYDLQIELVDHLAASIEANWETEPEVSFAQALNKTYKSFGINGFSKIKEEKEKALRKKYNHLFWVFIVGYFKFPKIMMTLAFTFLLFSLLKLIENDGLFIGIYVLLFLPFGLLYEFYIFPKHFTINLISGKSFLLINYLKSIKSQMLFIFLFSFQSLNFFTIFSHKVPNSWLQLGTAFIMAFYTIVIYAGCFFVPQKVCEHFTEQFPQFVKS